MPHLLQTFRESNVYYIAWYFTESAIPFIPKYLLFGFSEIKCKQLFSIQGQVYDFFLSSTSIERQMNFWEKTLCEQEQVKICKVVFLKMEFQKFIFFSLLLSIITKRCFRPSLPTYLQNIMKIIFFSEFLFFFLRFQFSLIKLLKPILSFTPTHNVCNSSRVDSLEYI